MQNTCAGIAALLIISLISSLLKPDVTDAYLSEEASVSLSPNYILEVHEPTESDFQNDGPGFSPIDIPLSDELQLYAHDLCMNADPPVPFEMVMAIAEHESNFDTNAIGHNSNGSSDYGLMQINSSTMPLMLEVLGIQTADELMDPKINLQAGVYILSMHMDKFQGNPSSALMAYQCGAGGAEKKLLSGVTSTTFSKDILLRMHEFEERNDV